jgi:hypothetical protein
MRHLTNIGCFIPGIPSNVNGPIRLPIVFEAPSLPVILDTASKLPMTTPYQRAPGAGTVKSGNV